jgi:hypothetical protein
MPVIHVTNRKEPKPRTPHKKVILGSAELDNNSSSSYSKQGTHCSFIPWDCSSAAGLWMCLANVPLDAL